MTNQTITKDGRKYKLVPIDEPDTKPYRLTVTKHFDFEVYPHDLPETMTWVAADKYIKENLPEWRMPTKEELLLMQEHQDKIGGFKTPSSSGSDYPQWYCSCTEHRVHPSFVWGADFSDGGGGWLLLDDGRLSCRLVRLVPAAG